MDVGDSVRFRVISETFYDNLPMQKEQLMARRATAEANNVDISKVPMVSIQRPPYTIMGSIAEDGLGLLSWWDKGDSL